MKKRVLSSVLAAMMIISLFAGCTGGNNGGGAEDLDIDLSVLDGLEYPLCSAEEIELTAHYPKFVGNIVEEGELKGERTVYDEARKKTNITLKTTVGKDQDGAQAFNLMLLEERIPDIVYSNLSNLNAAGYVEGALVDLKPYVTNEAIMPNLAKIYKENPDRLATVTAPDGGVYCCPKLREEGPTQGWFVRSDWMEKLGLENPKTYDEFVNVMDKIRNGDPNGNGKKDEIPWIGDVADLFYFFGLNGGRDFDVDAEGNMYCPKWTEDYKTALITIADWYAKGYIDQEVYTRKNPRGELWGSNVGGMTYEWFSSTMAYNTNIKNVPGFHVASIMPPANINGDVYCHSPGAIVESNGWGISVDNEHLVETLRYFDFWYSDEGSCLNAMGIEGRDWETDKDGNPKYTSKATSYEGGAPKYVRDIGCVAIGYFMRQKWLNAGMTDECLAANQAYIDADFTIDLIPNYNFTEEEQDIITNKWTACQTYISEFAQRAVMGLVDVEAEWDKYVAELKKMGIEECEKVHTDAYHRYLDLLASFSK